MSLTHALPPQTLHKRWVDQRLTMNCNHTPMQQSNGRKARGLRVQSVVVALSRIGAVPHGAICMAM